MFSTTKIKVMDTFKKSLHHLKILIILVCLTFIAFFPSLHNGFTDWDDKVHLLKNPDVRAAGINDVLDIFTSTVNHTYIPLTTLSHAVEYSLFGFDPFHFHLHNLLLHIGVAALVFWFILRLNYSTAVAGLTALIFAVHPMRVESVAWVTERKDVLYGLFFMLSLICYLKYLDKKNVKIYSLSVLFGLLSMLSKAMALTLPAALLLCDWHQGRKRSASLVLDKIPYLLYILPLTWITFSKVSVIYSAHPNVYTSALTGLWTFAFYLSKFIWPVPLSPVYYLPQPISIFEWMYVKALAIVILFCLFCVVFRKNRAVLLGVGIHMIGAPFMIRFNAVMYNREIIAADRYVYLPSVGMCFLLGFGIVKLYDHFRKKGIIWQRGWSIFVSFVLGTLIILTYHQCAVWKDNQSIMTAVIRAYPAADFAYNNRAIADMREGRHALALADFSRAIEHDPRKAHYYSNRGNLYTMTEQFELALKDFDQAVVLKPDDAVALYNRGTLYSEMGRYDEAVADFDRALEIKPDYREAARNRLLAVERR